MFHQKMSSLIFVQMVRSVYTVHCTHRACTLYSTNILQTGFVFLVSTLLEQVMAEVMVEKNVCPIKENHRKPIPVCQEKAAD